MAMNMSSCREFCVKLSRSILLRVLIRWIKKAADPGESKRILERLYSVRDRSQAGSLPVSIPVESIAVNGVMLA